MLILRLCRLWRKCLDHHIFGGKEEGSVVVVVVGQVCLWLVVELQHEEEVDIFVAEKGGGCFAEAGRCIFGAAAAQVVVAEMKGVSLLQLKKVKVHCLALVIKGMYQCSGQMHKCHMFEL
ncbi:hypothetical protein VNO78_00783 [Psophocarpus tetragonolobus]|uniref:Uncharacterized protein n=1 Tax=Psophocarpus tetragonolobus TaxID=3891 RepID=A0AAN9XU02_PSOTE